MGSARAGIVCDLNARLFPSFFLGKQVEYPSIVQRKNAL